ncbi:MAG TPA: hypothetical protein QF359_00420 [Rhodospirillales bacterium]|nr:hypothetical protein [Rhodospirillales bacterium]
MKKYKFLIFAIGTITLTLKVLASRFMTPYFGVSLYIWSGILLNSPDMPSEISSK